MPQVTKLVPAKRRKGRVHVHLDASYAFSLPGELAAALSVGQLISDSELDELRREAESQDALDRALRFLEYRPRSKAEVADYLRRKGYDTAVCDAAVHRLAASGYLDDRAFATWWVANRCEHRPRGRWALHWELTQRGVAAEVIAEAVAHVDDFALAERVALGKAPRYRGLDARAFAARMSGLLRRRGFASEAVAPAVRTAWESLEPAADNGPR